MKVISTNIKVFKKMYKFIFFTPLHPLHSLSHPLFHSLSTFFSPSPTLFSTLSPPSLFIENNVSTGCTARNAFYTFT
jgi:hypothetical protein